MSTITPNNMSGKHIIVTMATTPGRRAQKFVIDRDSRADFLGIKTGKVSEPATGASPYEIYEAREERWGRFYFDAQEVKARKGVLEVNEMLRSLGTGEVVKVELVDREKVTFCGEFF